MRGGVVWSLVRRVFLLRERVWLELATNQKRAHQLKQQGPVLVANSNQLISEAVGEVTNSSSMATRDLLSQLPSLVDNYQLPFDLNDLSQYKAGLYSHFDEKLSAELDRVSATALTGMHEATQSKLIGERREEGGMVEQGLVSLQMPTRRCYS